MMHEVTSPNRPDVESKRRSYVTSLFRVYNYYRIFIALCMLLIFLQISGQVFIGKQNPDLFLQLLITYLGVNILTAIAGFVVSEKLLSRGIVIFGVLLFDIFMLTFLMKTSGGILSGLGNFLLFTVAYSGVLIHGRISTVTPAIAVLSCFYSAFHTQVTRVDLGPDGYFQTGLLGVALFVVNLLFQYVSRQLQEKEMELSTLEKLNQLEIIAQTARDELDQTNSRFQVLLQSAGEGVLGLELDGSVSFANPKASALLGAEQDELVKRRIYDFLVETNAQSLPTDHDQKLPQERKLHENLTGPAPAEAYEPDKWQTANGETFFVEYSCEPLCNSLEQVIGLVIIFQNITQRRQQEQTLHHNANFDPLTDIANRLHFQETLRSAMARSKRSKQTLAVMFLDLDRFKYINDTLGHHAGDTVLKTVARRLKKAVRASDMVARLGGDEFAVILVDMDRPTSASIAAATIIRELKMPIPLQGSSIETSTSIGIAIYQGEDVGVDTLLKSADTAMYKAKSEGGSIYRFFLPEMQKEAEEKQRIPILLDNAIKNNEFKLLYQPIVSLKDNKTRSLEALIRWSPMGADPIPPDTFITIAEECGRIADIGKWVMSTVCRQAGEWQAQGEYPTIAINISTKQLATSDFRELFQRELIQYGVSADHIEIELTETSVMENPDFVMEELNRFHTMGVRISVDDFGTGYSSLDYLRRLPLDTLKIDKSFTSGIGKSKSDEEIIRLMISMAHTLDLEVIAEGVETKSQLEFLIAHDCDLVQGYLLAKPCAVDSVNKLFNGIRLD
ncbi:MAG: diguanylate cyclase (GGDEF)-like protein/PAS domain S-box-containing protein [Candidatus Azotimanducaceae bacterium]|jgi:diguanylate cyclase (GGDEF)-like protein/PAS domain S-box-containing protein